MSSVGPEVRLSQQSQKKSSSMVTTNKQTVRTSAQSLNKPIPEELKLKNNHHSALDLSELPNLKKNALRKITG